MMWLTVPFSQVSEIITGNTPPKKEPQNYRPGIPWVKPPDLDAWEPITKTKETLSQIGQQKARVLPPKTVMVCCIGSIGRVGIAGTTLATNQQINSLVFGPLVEPKFGFYYCRSISHVFHAAARKAVVPILNKTNFSRLKIPLPPLSEQRKIVEILDRADALRKKRAEADAKAERILPALFIKMFGDPALNPRGWPDKTFNDIIVETKYGTSTRANTDGKGVPVLRMNNIDSRGRLDLTKLKHVDLKSQELSKYELKSGDLLFNRTNSRKLVGKTGLWQGEIKAIPASYLIRVRVDQTQVLPEYVWAYMNTPFLKQILYDKARRSIGMANINAQELRSLPILIPPDLESQQPFTEMIARLDLLTVKQAADANAKLDNLFHLLLHRAFSGELTAKWREEHKEQLQAEMEEQAKILAASKAKQSTKRRRRRASPK